MSDVRIDGKRGVRSEGSVPEMSAVLEGVPMYNATVSLEPMENSVSGVGGVEETGVSSSVVGFAVNNPTDGQMLQYSESDSAFVNVTTVGV